jgi:hypothetical protein
MLVSVESDRQSLEIVNTSFIPLIDADGTATWGLANS